MVNLLHNPTINNFLSSFPQEDRNECLEVLCLIGIKSVNSQLISLGQLWSIAQPNPERSVRRDLCRKTHSVPSLDIPVKHTQQHKISHRKSEGNILVTRKERKPKPFSSRKVPVYLKDVNSKISELTCRDRFNWHKLHRERQEFLKNIPGINISNIEKQEQTKEKSTQFSHTRSLKSTRSLKINQKTNPSDNGPKIIPIKANNGILETLPPKKQPRIKRGEFNISYARKVSASMIEKAPLMSSYVYEEESKC